MVTAFAQTSRPGALVQTERVRAELLAHAPDGIAAGRTVWVALRLQHQPHWHTYWKNPGDSGLPTQLQWTLPPGVLAGDIDWPVPQKIPVGDLANYGFEGDVLLPVPLTITPEYKPPLFGGALEVKLQAAWLVCKTECIPEDGTFALEVPLQSSTAIHSTLFDSAFAAAPQPLSVGSTAKVEQGRLLLSVAGLPAALQGQSLGVFPETPELTQPAAAPIQSWQGDVWTGSVPLSSLRSESPQQLAVVLTAPAQTQTPTATSTPTTAQTTPSGWRTVATIEGGWPAAPIKPVAVSPALTQALADNAARSSDSAATASRGNTTLTAALLGALLGGLILNLMPCVFPVLAIKVVGFARHADDRRGHRIAGFAYTAGVIASFVALGLLLLGLRAAGEQLGWGFQLQSPAMVAGLAVLFTVIGLNLAGLFEFGGVLPRALVSWEAKNPIINSFLSGVLAVAIASPCTAPFMGASLGFAVGLPAEQALAVFAAIGVGMALPYLLASVLPGFAKLLPRPGGWMQTLRRLMAFPMFATVAWLIWVLGQQSGIDGAGALLALLVAVAFVLWATAQTGRTRWLFGAASVALLVFGLPTLGPNVLHPLDAAPQRVSADARWQPWQPGRVDQLVETGRPVFVDFTAAWCVTCQYNKKTTLQNAEVLAAFDAKNIAMLRADWTRRDPAITAALTELGRSGVPVYVFYAAGRRPVVLSEILDADEVKRVVGTF
ncbi:MAG: thioredoxin family protein [Burkholderiaceae bacterium]